MKIDVKGEFLVFKKHICKREHANSDHLCVEIREYFKIRSRTDKPFKVTSTSIKSSLVDEKFHGARH